MASQDKTGGYCPKCDTVWVAPGKCNCKIIIPLTDREADVANIRYIEGWNAAIEAAAQCVEQANRDGPYQAIVSHREIRKLKK